MKYSLWRLKTKILSRDTNVLPQLHWISNIFKHLAATTDVSLMMWHWCFMQLFSRVFFSNSVLFYFYFYINILWLFKWIYIHNICFLYLLIPLISLGKKYLKKYKNVGEIRMLSIIMLSAGSIWILWKVYS